jgi:hypothetical protein
LRQRLKDIEAQALVAETSATGRVRPPNAVGGDEGRPKTSPSPVQNQPKTAQIKGAFQSGLEKWTSASKYSASGDK